MVWDVNHWQSETNERGRVKKKARRVLESEAWIAMYQLVVSQREHYHATAASCDLSPPQAMLLYHLAGTGGMPMAAIADLLACHASNVTGLVDRLEERGIIERIAAPQDRRVKLITTTRRGDALRRRLLARL